MRDAILIVFVILLVCSGCKKTNLDDKTASCPHPIPTTIPQRAYTSGFTEITYQQSHCGYLPLGKKNYWVFQDSVFDSNTGAFLSTFIDTLRFERTFRFSDSIVWWMPKITFFPGYFKGYYNLMYSTDTVLYTLGDGGPGSLPSAKWCFPLHTDSIHLYPHWSDAGGYEVVGYKLYSPVTVPAGSFNDCSLFIHRWNSTTGGWYIYFKPQVGILKFIVRRGPGGSIISHTSTLLSYHIE